MAKLLKMRKKKLRRKKKFNVKTKITGAIRKIWFWSNAHKIVKDRCLVKDDLYRCERCRRLTEKIQIDHDPPVVDPVLGWRGYDIFIERMFVDPSIGLRGLCKNCHDNISAGQNQIRKENRKKKI